MSLEHVQPQQHVHRLLLQHGKTGGQVILLDLNLNHVNASYDSLHADAFRNTGPPRVDQTHNVATFGTRARHYRGLGA